MPIHYAASGMGASRNGVTADAGAGEEKMVARNLILSYVTLVMVDSYPPPPGYTQAPAHVLPSLLNVPL